MLSKFSVKKPYTVVVAVVLVILLGYVSFGSMTVDLLPSMNLPYAIVMTTYPGASPEEVETTITKPIEQRMATVSNIKNITSTSQENASAVILEFSQTANMDSVTIEMRESLDQIKGYWPETVANPIIMKLNPNMMPVMVAAVSAKGQQGAEASKTVSEKVIPDIESVEGVASVSTTGSVEETVQITVSPDKVTALGDDVKASLDYKFNEAEHALSDAKSKVEEGKQALESGKKQAASQMGEAESQISVKSQEITQGQLEISERLSQLDLAEAQLTQQLAQIELQDQTLKAQKQELETLKAQEQELKAQYEALMQEIAANPPETPEQTVMKTVLMGKLAMIENYDAAMAQIDQGLAQTEAAKQQIDAGKAQIQAGRETLNQLKSQLAAGAITLAQARGQMSSAQVQAAAELGTAGANIAAGEQQIAGKQAELDAAKEEAYKKADISSMLTADTVKTLLAAQNFNMPAGYVNESGIDYLVRVGDKFRSIEELKDLVLVSMEGMDPVKLSDVADVSKVDNSDEVYAKINGEQGILLSIQKQTGYSTGDVSKRILERFKTLEKENKDIKAVTLMDQGVYIDLVVNSVLENLIYGGALAILILLLFLRSFRPTIIIACSIPISIMAAIVLMYFSGVTLNVISLSGLALGVGMLVDNSIVVIENIYRLRNEENMPARQAAIEGARQVAGAIAASTLTTICVFAPIVFAEGITRQLFVDMGLTIAYSLLASLGVALTLVPMMSAGLLKRTQEKEGKLFIAIKNGYGRLLEKALKYKIVVLVGALLLLVLSGALAVSRGTAFMPEMESTQISIDLETKEGTLLTDTAKVSDEAIKQLKSIEDITDVGAMASSGNMFSAGQNKNPNRIQIYALLREKRQYSNEELKALIEKKTKGLNCTVTVNMSNMDMSALGNSGVVVQIKGKDLDTLQKTAKEVAKIVTDVKGTKNVSDGLEKTTDELRIIVNKQKATAHNLTVAQVYKELAAKAGAKTSSTALSTEDEDFDIYVTDQKNEQMSREDIKNLTLTVSKQDGTSETVALKDIADFQEGTGLQAISRKAQSRYMNVTAEIKDGENIGIVSGRAAKALEGYKAPAGYEVTMQGEDKTIQDSMVELFKMLALAVVFMYLIMVAQFQSLRSPFIIMFTIPLAFTGGLLALWLAGDPISVIAMVGFVMLSGIIVNNGIVFVDYTNQLIASGKETKEALLEAGKTRLRPIIMTALTTVLGLSTMAIGVGMGADMTQPMALVTIGGLIYGTLLTLFVVPCIFALFNKKERARLLED